MGKPVIDTHRGDSVFRRDRAGKVLAYRGGAAGDAAGANSSNARTSGRGRGMPTSTAAGWTKTSLPEMEHASPIRVVPKEQPPNALPPNLQSNHRKSQMEDALIRRMFLNTPLISSLMEPHTPPLPVIHKGNKNGGNSSVMKLDELKWTMYQILNRTDLSTMTVKESRALLEIKLGLPKDSLEAQRHHTTHWVTEFITADPTEFGAQLLLGNTSGAQMADLRRERPPVMEFAVDEEQATGTEKKKTNDDHINSNSRKTHAPGLSSSSSFTTPFFISPVSTIKGPFGWVCPHHTPFLLLRNSRPLCTFRVGGVGEYVVDEEIESQEHRVDLQRETLPEMDLAIFLPAVPSGEGAEYGTHVLTSKNILARFSPIIRQYLHVLNPKDQSTLEQLKYDDSFRELANRFGKGIEGISVLRLEGDLHIDSIIFVLQLLDVTSFAAALSTLNALGNSPNTPWVMFARTVFGILKLLVRWEIRIPGVVFVDEAMQRAVARIAQRAKLWKSGYSPYAEELFSDLEIYAEKLGLVTTVQMLQAVREGRKVDIETGMIATAIYMRARRASEKSKLRHDGTSVNSRIKCEDQVRRQRGRQKLPTVLP